MYVLSGTGRAIMYNTFEVSCSGDVTAVRPSDGKSTNQISSEYMYNVISCTV
jgi:hypothetical protein